MTTMISCPNCKTPNDPQNQNCEQCGISLAIAAAIAEINVSRRQLEQPEDIAVTPELLVPKIGDHMLEKGLIDEDQLLSALDFQKERLAAGAPVLLGQALVFMNLINQKDLDLAITEQIVSLQNAVHDSNRHLEDRVQERTAELQQALQQLTDLNTLKTNFISNISHELRTPLTHLVGYLDLLKDESLGPITDAQSQAIGVMLKSYDRLHSLIDNLIQFALVSQGQLSIQAEVFEVVHLLKTAFTHLQTAADSRSINLVSNLPPDTLKVKVDEKKIIWVLEQLVDNAIKFNQPGGEVILSGMEDDGMVTFRVQDNGIGIPQEQIDEIFEPFHQLDGSATRKHGGTGIGLALTQQILEAHGVSLKVQSKPGKGSVFEFSLPPA